MSDDKSNPLPQLLVTEAIRELAQRFEGMNDKEAHIENHICALGRKPGFAMASQLCRAGQESVEGPEDIAKFLGTKFTPALFNVPAQCQISGKTLTITFGDRRLPTWFNCLQNPDGSQPTAEQSFWTRAYAFFMSGVYAGALLHFGQKATPKWNQKPEAPRAFVFTLEELDGTWEFSANMQH